MISLICGIERVKTRENTVLNKPGSLEYKNKITKAWQEVTMVRGKRERKKENQTRSDTGTVVEYVGTLVVRGCRDFVLFIP